MAQTINSAHAVDGLPIIVTQLVLIGGGFPDVEFIIECEKLLPSALIGSHLWRIQATRLHVNAHALRLDGGGEVEVVGVVVVGGLVGRLFTGKTLRATLHELICLYAQEFYSQRFGLRLTNLSSRTPTVTHSLRTIEIKSFSFFPPALLCRCESAHTHT